MANNQAIAGRCYIKVNGIQYKARGNFKYSPVKSEKETVVGLDGIHGHKVIPKAPYIEGDLSDAGGLSLTDFETMSDATVTLELANGKQIVLRDAVCTTQIENDAVEGQFTVRFEGMDASEVVVNA